MTAAKRAHMLVSKAIRDGFLIRQPCIFCGREKTDAHHEDYEKPYDVIWLCRRHHLWRHWYFPSVEAQQDAYESREADRAALREEQAA